MKAAKVNIKDPKSIVVQFNECINNQDIEGLAQFMTEDHTFIDREGKAQQPKKAMIQGWKHFFETFPKYRNTFTRVELRDNLVVVLGHAFWSEQQPFDPVIWTATIVHDRIREWRIYADTEENRKIFHLD